MDQPRTTGARTTGAPRALPSDRPLMDVDAVRSELLSQGVVPRLEWSEQTGSSNDDLAALARGEEQSWPDLSVLGTERQTAGRGRLGRSWIAPPSSALAISILLRPAELAREQYGWLSMLGARAVVETLRSYGLTAGIKWPNDVLVQHGEANFKICGVLAQLLSTPRGHPAVVLGIGVNVSQRREELPVEHATSLFVAGAGEIGRERLLIDLLSRFAHDYRCFTGASAYPQTGRASTAVTQANLRREITEMVITIGQQVRAELPGRRFLHGCAVGLDPCGALVIQDAQGTSTAVSAADVVHVRRAAQTVTDIDRTDYA